MVAHFAGIFENIKHQSILIQEIIGRVQFPCLHQVMRKMIVRIVQSPIPSENGYAYPTQFIVKVFLGKQQHLLLQIIGNPRLTPRSIVDMGREPSYPSGEPERSAAGSSDTNRRVVNNRT